MKNIANIILIVGCVFSLSALGGQEITVGRFVTPDGERIFFQIPNDIENPNGGTKLFPEAPLLITVIAVGDYDSALQLLAHPKIKVNLPAWRLSAMCGNKPSNMTALIAAVGHARSSEIEQTLMVIKRLLELGADTNQRCTDGFSALHVAVNNNRITEAQKKEIIELLLSHEARLDLVWGKHGTPRDLALRLELDRIQPRIVDLLGVPSQPAAE